MHWHVRVGPGPVFAYEWLMTTRRWQLYAVRAVFIGIILLGMMFAWHSLERFTRYDETVSIQALARYGESLYATITSIELSLVLLIAPAVTAGAVCLDKTRGTLDHILATDLSNAEIVIGKLGVRLVPVLGLIACALPVAALAGLFGGIDPSALAGSFLTAIGCALLGCSLALTLSVWGRKTHEVLMLTYLLLVIWLVSPALVLLIAFFFSSPSLPNGVQALAEWLGNLNPYYLAMAPYTNPGRVGPATHLAFLTACVFTSMLLLSLATLRIRKATLQQLGRPLRKPRSVVTALLARPPWLLHIPRPSLDRNPVLWREWHHTQPSWLARLVWFIYAAFGLLWVGLSLLITTQLRGDAELIAPMNLFQVSTGFLLVSVSACSSLAEERARGSLDVLLATPLTTWTILAGKWLGSFRQVAYVVLWPAITTGLLAAQSGMWAGYFLLLALILAYGAVITSLGLAMATWVNRLGRAVALCVTIYIGGSIAWLIIVGMFLSPGLPDSVALSLMMGSPLYSTVIGTMAVMSPRHFMASHEVLSIMAGEFIWSVSACGLAFLLFTATVATFDRHLGRVSEPSGRPMRSPYRKGISKTDPEVPEWFATGHIEVSRDSTS
jgi:ABC-type transport system involved in multi-copper enzyme maturation permease subunit